MHIQDAYIHIYIHTPGVPTHTHTHTHTHIPQVFQCGPTGSVLQISRNSTGNSSNATTLQHSKNAPPRTSITRNTPPAATTTDPKALVAGGSAPNHRGAAASWPSSPSMGTSHGNDTAALMYPYAFWNRRSAAPLESHWHTFSVSELPPWQVEALDLIPAHQRKHHGGNSWREDRAAIRAVAGGFTAQGPQFTYTSVVQFDEWASGKWEKLGRPLDSRDLPSWTRVEGSTLKCYPAETIEVFFQDLGDPASVGPLPLVMNKTCGTSVCKVLVARCNATFYCDVSISISSKLMFRHLHAAICACHMPMCACEYAPVCMCVHVYVCNVPGSRYHASFFE